MEWPYHSFDCVLLYWIVQLDFQFYSKSLALIALALLNWYCFQTASPRRRRIFRLLRRIVFSKFCEHMLVEVVSIEVAKLLQNG